MLHVSIRNGYYLLSGYIVVFRFNVVTVQNKLFTRKRKSKDFMSDHLIDWFKDHLTPLYQSALDSTEDHLSSEVGSLFEGGARIIYNHEAIDLAKFSEGLRASSAAVTRTEVEWKEIKSSTGGNNSGTEQDSIIAGYFVVTRSMKFRIRVGPAQTLQHCFFSAKIKGDSGNKGDGDNGSLVISELFITSISEQAPIQLLHTPVNP